VVLGIQVYQEFYALSSASSFLNTVSGPSYGGHAVTALGYDRYGVTIENSWSAGWGNNGFAKLSWHFITTQVFAAYAVGPLSVTPPTAPHVRAVGPTGGKATGAQHITIVGTNFQAGSTLTFGGVRSPRVFVDGSGTRIVAMTPPHSPGPVTVNVTGANGKSPSWGKSRFQFVGAPRPTALSPNRGPHRGGTHVLIVGTRLNGAGVM